MNISQAAQQTGLSAKQIRDYEKQNLLPETQRSESRYRVYARKRYTAIALYSSCERCGFFVGANPRIVGVARQSEPPQPRCEKHNRATYYRIKSTY